MNFSSRSRTSRARPHLVLSRFAQTANGWPAGVPLQQPDKSPEAPRGQQPWRIHCLLDLGLTCELLAAGCDPGLPTLLRDVRQNGTERVVLTDQRVTSYRKYDVGIYHSFDNVQTQILSEEVGHRISLTSGWRRLKCISYVLYIYIYIYILLTVHLRIILATNQLNAQILFL